MYSSPFPETEQVSSQVLSSVCTSNSSRVLGLLQEFWRVLAAEADPVRNAAGPPPPFVCACKAWTRCQVWQPGHPAVQQSAVAHVGGECAVVLPSLAVTQRGLRVEEYV